MKKAVFHTPFGWAGVSVTEKGIAAIILPRKSRREVELALSREGRGSVKESVLLAKAVKLLRKYFSGKPVSFDLPLDMRYYTAFQQAVWKATAQIPFGETRSYAWIAGRIKRPKAARAVGQAVGANPVPIIIS